LLWFFVAIVVLEVIFT